LPLGGSGLGLSSLTDLTDGLVGNALGSSFQSEGLQAEALKSTSFAPPSVTSTTTGSGQTVPITQTSQNATPVLRTSPKTHPRHESGRC
jgi:hypothetical protein